uniref:Kinesin motor domain-containing protein n=1 Tax=Cryptomonas curvata TaxID=233186 RepID=A0A7S0M5A3_9CRYP|mmetsp:Transcript_24707/g.51624  ORF Transcript_24707/g.51624 Transcript_24707/m.51624 type:complete len:666 (+) Transcript_24707:1-1998(+)
MKSTRVQSGESPAANFFMGQDALLRVMTHCTIMSCVQLISINKYMYTQSLDDGFFAVLCGRLMYEFKLYAPRSICTQLKWKDVFLDLYGCRRLFQGIEGRNQRGEEDLSPILREIIHGHENDMPPIKRSSKNLFQVAVAARLRPTLRMESVEDINTPTMVLPIHQRLQLIRSQRGCSMSEARRILWDSSGQINDPWSTAELDETSQNDNRADLSWKVDANEESLLEIDEIEKTCPNTKSTGFPEGVHPCVLAVHPGVAGSVLMCAPGTGLRSFTFDSVYGEKCQQVDVYMTSVQRLAVSFLNGRNACVLAYGQTGSGKTHTMFGRMGEGDDPAMHGIVPRAAHEVLEGIRFKEASGVKTKIFVSYVEIYGEQVTDLLHEGRSVGAWHGIAHRKVLDGGCQVELSSAEARDQELLNLLRSAEERKRRAATAMNERSSRAHSVLIFRLVQRDAQDGAVDTESTMCLADLGGSEQVLKSKVASCSTVAGGFLAKDERLQEAVNINLGLLSLRACITALVEGDSHVPYGNSKLTQLLSGALGGNCRSLVLVTGSMERRHALETLQSMRFGESCRKVLNAETDNAAIAGRAIRAIDDEIREVEAAIRSKERWETRRSVRTDALHQEDEATGRTEVVTTSVLVGAEEERERLAVLLERRRILTGGPQDPAA